MLQKLLFTLLAVMMLTIAGATTTMAGPGNGDGDGICIGTGGGDGDGDRIETGPETAAAWMTKFSAAVQRPT